MTDMDVQELVDAIAVNPRIGDVMISTGGFRKHRAAGRGKGKSGGYRVITFYTSDAIPVFLIDVFSKSDKANLSHAERNELKEIAGQLSAYGKRK